MFGPSLRVTWPQAPDSQPRSLKYVLSDIRQSRETVDLRLDLGTSLNKVVLKSGSGPCCRSFHHSPK